MYIYYIFFPLDTNSSFSFISYIESIQTFISGRYSELPAIPCHFCWFDGATVLWASFIELIS